MPAVEFTTLQYYCKFEASNKFHRSHNFTQFIIFFDNFDRKICNVIGQQFTNDNIPTMPYSTVY